MKYEKSCGAIIFRTVENHREYLVVLNKKPGQKCHWGFPKGHREGTENEYETAAREIREEIGLSVVFCGTSRAVSAYSPKKGVMKDAVYFLATIRNKCNIRLQKSEIEQYRWVNKADAVRLLTYDADVLTAIEEQE